MTKGKAGAVARLTSAWGDVIFSADDVEGMRVQMVEVLQCRAESESMEELAHYAGQGPAVWVGERIRKALISNDGVLTGKPLLSLAEVEDEVFVRRDDPMYGLCAHSIEDALVDALHAAVQLRAVDMPPATGPALIWRFCYRLAQVAALVADAGREEAYRKGKRGGPEGRGDVGEAKRLAIRYLWEHAFDADGKIRPRKALELEIWEMLFARRGEPSAFQIAGSPDRPTDRALKTVRSFIADGYKSMRDRGKKRLESDRDRLNDLAIEVYARRNSGVKQADATPDASPEQVE